MLLHHRQLTQITGTTAVGMQGTATAVDTNGVEAATTLVIDTTGISQSTVAVAPFTVTTIITSPVATASTSANTSRPSATKSSPTIGVIIGASAGVGTLICGLGILLFMICLRKRQRRRAANFVCTTEPKSFRTEAQQRTQNPTLENISQPERADDNPQALTAPRLSISKSLKAIQGQLLDEPITPSQIEQGTPCSEAHVPHDRRRSQQTDIWNDRDTIADPDATPPPTYSTGGRRSRRTLVFSPDGGDTPPVPPPPFEP